MHRAQSRPPLYSQSTYSRQETGCRPQRSNCCVHTPGAPCQALPVALGAGWRESKDCSKGHRSPSQEPRTGPTGCPDLPEATHLPDGEGGVFSSSIRPSSPALPRLGGIVLLLRTVARRPPTCWDPTRLCRFRRFTGNTGMRTRQSSNNCNHGIRQQAQP